MNEWMKVKSYLKGMTAAKHRRLRRNIRRDRNYGRNSCAVMWITIKKHWFNFSTVKITSSLAAFQNMGGLAGAAQHLTVCWSRSRCGYVHWWRSRELILQSVVARVLSIDKRRHKLSHDNRGVCCIFPSLFNCVLCWNMHVCSFKCQCRVKKMWQSVVIIFFQQ